MVRTQYVWTHLVDRWHQGTPPQLLRMSRAGKALLVRYDSVLGPKQDRHKDQAEVRFITPSCIGTAHQTGRTSMGAGN